MTEVQRQTSVNRHPIRALAIAACAGYVGYAAWDADILSIPERPMYPGHFVEDVPYTSFGDLAENVCPQENPADVLEWLAFHNRPVEPGTKTTDLWLPIC